MSQDESAQKKPNSVTPIVEPGSELPVELRQPIGQMVKAEVREAVEEALQPKAVKAKPYIAHVVVCLVAIAVLCGFAWLATWDDEYKRDGEWILIGVFSFVGLWFVSLVLSFILKIQTRLFHLSAVVIAATLFVTSIYSWNLLGPLLEFLAPKPWISTFLYAGYYFVAIGIFGNWYVAKALPTTSRKMIRTVSSSFVVLILIALGLYHYQKGKTEDGYGMEITYFPGVPVRNDDLMGAFRKLADRSDELAKEAKTKRDSKGGDSSEAPPPTEDFD